MKGWPKDSARCCAAIRAIPSELPPAAYGTRIFTGRDGHMSVDAVTGERITNVMMANRRLRRNIGAPGRSLSSQSWILQRLRSARQLGLLVAQLCRHQHQLGTAAIGG